MRYIAQFIYISMNAERLLKSLENEANEDIMELTRAKITQEKNDILVENTIKDIIRIRKEDT